MAIIAILIELVGITVIAVGIGLEIGCGGETYLIMITLGSCLVALGGILFGKFFKVTGK